MQRNSRKEIFSQMAFLEGFANLNFHELLLTLSVKATPVCLLNQ